MSTPHRLIDSVTAHVERHGARPAAALAARRWAADQPALAVFANPAALAAAARDADPAARDRLLSSLLRVGAGDEWAELTALAIVAPRLAWIIAGWAGHGVTDGDLADLEADLVGGCWEQVRAAMNGTGPFPNRPGLVLVDRAWSKARNRRAALRRRATHHTDIPDPGGLVAGRNGDPRSGVELLASAISDARRAGRVGDRPAAALFLTRVVGLSTTEAADRLGTTPGVVRVLRCRAVDHLDACSDADTNSDADIEGGFGGAVAA